MTDNKHDKRINKKNLIELFNECVQLSEIKNKDYGCETILDYMEFGLLVRMNDKINRLKNIIKNNIINVQNESIEDTCKDLINYSAYLALLNKGKLIK